MPSNHDLWQRIRDFALDGESDRFPFSARLSRENGWTRAQALDAIEEYKKFVYLMCVSDTPLTPSEAVDQVWHLHLVYTRSYWKDFCDGVLGRAIHHEPTKGGEQQTQHFSGQYETTLALYEREFGTAAPAEFWPTADERFAAPPRLQWVDRRNHWVIRKPAGLAGLLRTMVALPVVAITGCSDIPVIEDPMSSTGHSSDWVSWIVFGMIFLWIVLLGAFASKNASNDKDGKKSDSWWGGCGGGCSGCGGCGGCGG
jgi:hypothetical protein